MDLHEQVVVPSHPQYYLSLHPQPTPRRLIPTPEIGDVFGELTVIETGLKIGRRPEHACLMRCVCEVEKIIRVYSLQTGNSRSCGGPHRYIKAIKPDSDWLRVFSYFKTGATSRSRDFLFSLTLADIKRICQLACAYCGQEPSNTVRRRPGKPVVLRYSGIDRLDSNAGYSLGNVVPCCKFCNFAKNTLCLDDFLAQLARFGSRLRAEDISVLAASLMRPPS